MHSLPKFLLCEDPLSDTDFTFYVLHTAQPCLLFRFDDDGNGTADLTFNPDDARNFLATEAAAGRSPTTAMARIAREAGEFYLRALEETSND